MKVKKLINGNEPNKSQILTQLSNMSKKNKKKKNKFTLLKLEKLRKSAAVWSNNPHIKEFFELTASEYNKAPMTKVSISGYD